MLYLLTFLEGILSILSPCLLPLLPVYLSYFAGNQEENQKRGQIARILAFIAGFTLSFMVLGLVFSTLGSVVSRHQTVVNLVCGGAMVFFGLSYLHVIPLSLFGSGPKSMKVYDITSSFLFGLLYPVNLTPCVGAFLGSALALAATTGSVGQGTALLLVYSLGLGLPFLLSALIMSHLSVFFSKVKAHYAVIDRISGGLLVVMGVLVMTGLFQRFLALFT